MVIHNENRLYCCCLVVYNCKTTHALKLMMRREFQIICLTREISYDLKDVLHWSALKDFGRISEVSRIKPRDSHTTILVDVKF